MRPCSSSLPRSAPILHEIKNDVQRAPDQSDEMPVERAGFDAAASRLRDPVVPLAGGGGPPPSGARDGEDRTAAGRDGEGAAGGRAGRTTNPAPSSTTRHHTPTPA